MLREERQTLKQRLNKNSIKVLNKSWINARASLCIEPFLNSTFLVAEIFFCECVKLFIGKGAQIIVHLKIWSSSMYCGYTPLKAAVGLTLWLFHLPRYSSNTNCLSFYPNNVEVPSITPLHCHLASCWAVKVYGITNARQVIWNKQISFRRCFVTISTGSSVCCPCSWRV
jgi:hypothetical protein